MLEGPQLHLEDLQRLVGQPQEARPFVGRTLGFATNQRHVLVREVVVDLPHDREARQGAVEPEVVELLDLLPIAPGLLPAPADLLAALLEDMNLAFELCDLVDLLEAGQHASHAHLVGNYEDERGPAVTQDLVGQKDDVHEEGREKVGVRSGENPEAAATKVQGQGHPVGRRTPPAPESTATPELQPGHAAPAIRRKAQRPR
mmetsp:Transcript_48343/g.127662  ORF Transcript_48343/g.127662 Transcript_48343/m.127662 type:complete len:202 (-) Transcript_48343:874-1479(-)